MFVNGSTAIVTRSDALLDRPITAISRALDGPTRQHLTGASDVLQRHLAQVFGPNVKLPAHLVMDLTRNRDATRLGDSL